MQLWEIVSPHQKLKHTLNPSLVGCKSILGTACPWLHMNLWTGIRGHGDQQLARRGWSQQAVLLWHSWGENVPGTWLAPCRELAYGTDSGACASYARSTTKPRSLGETQRKRAPAGDERECCQQDGSQLEGHKWTGLERCREDHMPRADRCFSSLGFMKQQCSRPTTE